MDTEFTIDEVVRYLKEERLMNEHVLYHVKYDEFESTEMLIEDKAFVESKKPLAIYDFVISLVEDFAKGANNTSFQSAGSTYKMR